ncbi:hypothetical protein BDP27DRAFT_20824 [Rhodocollybia butyracea]|uniref:Uncharacterized protein n=1 Tax=Rhodocollybia butyracea TaxID=206335 RepID=A0A9P5UFT0_9AGAR|nr:hypothetical protein BDP27DRAFT_20824 [Rhodocollybia butyracea]
MEKRAKTLQALATFMDIQRALLTRTHADIDRLNELRSRAVAQPEEFADNLSEQLNDGAFRLSELEQAADSPPEGIEWSVFAKHDPSPLQALAEKSKQRPIPPPMTSNIMSDFQKQIKDAKSDILDPVFSTWNFSFKPVFETTTDEVDPPIDPAALKKAKEREKIKELKKHKIMPSGLTLTPSGHRTRGPGGVFIRQDMGDESMDVEISVDNEGNSRTTTSSAEGTAAPSRRSTSVTSNQLPSSPVSLGKRNHQSISKACANTHSLTKPPRIKITLPPMPLTAHQRRRSSRAASSCADDMEVDDSTFPPTPDSLPEPESEVDPEDSEQDDASPTKDFSNSSMPKSQTYRQAWSTSEQQLLEALLEEIPEGEKNRWKKISSAMNGTRTPRQVASRVQKYFEKLKKFGIE